MAGQAWTGSEVRGRPRNPAPPTQIHCRSSFLSFVRPAVSMQANVGLGSWENAACSEGRVGKARERGRKRRADDWDKWRWRWNMTGVRLEAPGGR